MPETELDAQPHLTGGCQCGAVRYALSTEPRNLTLCQCRMCQKASGGPMMAFGRVKSDAIAWTRGAPSFYQSSSMAQRGFCAQCGTPLTYQHTESAISVTLGSLDDPTPFAPGARLGIEAALPWTEHIAELPSQTTEAWMTPEMRASFRSNQHPDRDG